MKQEEQIQSKSTAGLFTAAEEVFASFAASLNSKSYLIMNDNVIMQKL